MIRSNCYGCPGVGWVQRSRFVLRAVRETNPACERRGMMHVWCLSYPCSRGLILVYDFMRFKVLLFSLLCGYALAVALVSRHGSWKPQLR